MCVCVCVCTNSMIMPPERLVLHYQVRRQSIITITIIIVCVCMCVFVGSYLATNCWLGEGGGSS